MDSKKPSFDAAVYFKNVPSLYGADEMRSIGETFGTVTRVHMLESSLVNGRRAGFIHMDNKEAALQVVDKIKATCLDGIYLHGHLEKVTRLDFAKSSDLGEPRKFSARAPKATYSFSSRTTTTDVKPMRILVSKPDADGFSAPKKPIRVQTKASCSSSGMYDILGKQED